MKNLTQEDFDKTALAFALSIAPNGNTGAFAPKNVMAAATMYAVSWYKHSEQRQEAFQELVKDLEKRADTLT